MVKDLIRPQDWLVKIDLKDAYLLVLIHLARYKYLQFKWHAGPEVPCSSVVFCSDCHVLLECNKVNETSS